MAEGGDGKNVEAAVRPAPIGRGKGGKGLGKAGDLFHTVGFCLGHGQCKYLGHGPGICKGLCNVYSAEERSDRDRKQSDRVSEESEVFVRPASTTEEPEAAATAATAGVQCVGGGGKRKRPRMATTPGVNGKSVADGGGGRDERAGGAGAAGGAARSARPPPVVDLTDLD